jgi:hypothetical protein
MLPYQTVNEVGRVAPQPPTATVSEKNGYALLEEAGRHILLAGSRASFFRPCFLAFYRRS